MTKLEKVEKLLIEAGFKPTSDFRIVRGPKVKPDVLECWSIRTTHNGRSVEVYSAYTITELAKKGLNVLPNYRETCLYGDYVAEPK